MTALVTGDLHLSDNPRDVYRHRFVQRLPAIAKKYDVQQVIILGDLTEEKDRHSAWLTNRIADYIYDLTQVCYVEIAMGNHDYISIDDPFFQFLQYIPRVKFIAKPTAFTIGGLGMCLFLPHTRDHVKDWKGVEASGANWVFAHNTFDGALVGNGKRMAGVPLDAIPVKNVPVIAGDVHVPQKFGRVTYVGSPYTVDFGDDFEPRMLLLDETRMKSIPCDGPQKRLVECVAGQELYHFPDLSPGDILKVRVTIQQKHVAEWDEIKNWVHRWGEQHKVVIFAVIPELVAGKEARIKPAVTSPKSDREVLTKFARARDVDDNTLRTGLFLMDGRKS